MDMTQATRSPWFRAFVAVSLVHLVFVGFDLDPWNSISKCFCAPLLAAWVWRSGGPQLLLDALVLCFFGDLFLELDGLFTVGMAAFAGAHVCFVAYFLRRGTTGQQIGWAIPYVAAAAALVVWSWEGLEPFMRGAVPVYALLLVATAATSMAFDRLAGLGGAAFLVSDGLIALGEAGRIESGELWSRLTIMVLYLMGIALLAIGTLRHEESP